MQENLWKDLFKCDLHLHPSGSARIESIYQMAIKKNLNLSLDEVRKLYFFNGNGFEEFENSLRLVSKFIMQDQDSIYRIFYECLEDLNKEKVVYASLRICPTNHTKFLTKEEVVECCLDAMKDAYKYFKISSNLILCIDRSKNLEDGFEVLDLAKKYKLPIDFVGKENKGFIDYFLELLEEAKNSKITIIMHVGEQNLDCEYNVLKAIHWANRLDHCVFVPNNFEETLKKRDLGVVVCPTSNLLISKVDHEYYFKNIKKYLKRKVKLGIGDDNKTLLNTNLNKEFELLYNYGIDLKEIVSIINKSFDLIETFELRERLSWYKKINSKIFEEYKKI